MMHDMYQKSGNQSGRVELASWQKQGIIFNPIIDHAEILSTPSTDLVL